MKRFLSFIIAVCILFTFPFPALAEWSIAGERSSAEIQFEPDTSNSSGVTVTITGPANPPSSTSGHTSGTKAPHGALLSLTDVEGDYRKGSVYGPKLSTKELAQVKVVVIKAINSCIREGMTDREKIITLVNKLCDKVSYADDWSKNRANTAWGALVYGEAQCSGYARALLALLHGVGIEAKYVHASKNALNTSHQWVLVKCDGQWYHLDPQLVDDYMEINTTTMTISYPRPIVLMASYMSFETKGLPKTASKDIVLQ